MQKRGRREQAVQTEQRSQKAKAAAAPTRCTNSPKGEVWGSRRSIRSNFWTHHNPKDPRTFPQEDLYHTVKLVVTAVVVLFGIVFSLGTMQL